MESIQREYIAANQLQEVYKEQCKVSVYTEQCKESCTNFVIGNRRNDLSPRRIRKNSKLTVSVMNKLLYIRLIYPDFQHGRVDVVAAAVNVDCTSPSPPYLASIKDSVPTND